jgi:4-amino-4-deoxy-L-arabinose transferase-like glycosyltransferase
MQVRVDGGRAVGLAVRVRAALPVAAVVALALALRVPLVAGGQVDYDEGVYWESLRALAAGHPLFTSVYSSQPPAFLLLLLPGHLALGGGIAGERMTGLVLALAGLVAVYRTARTLGTPRAGLLAAAVLAADPLFVRESVALQADGPSIALALVALALAAEARTRPGGRAQVLLAAGAGALLAAAVLTKLLAVAAAPPLAVLLAGHPDRTGGPWRQALRALAAALLGGALASAALLVPFASAWPEMWRQAIGLHLGARSLAAGGLEGRMVVQEVPVALLGAGGLVVGLRRTPALVAAAAAWAVPAALLLAAQHPLWSHHAVALVAPLALLASGLAAVLPERPRLLAAVAVVLVAASAASALSVAVMQRPEATTRPSVVALRAVTAPGDLVVTDDEFAAAMAGRSTPPELVDTSEVRVTSGDLQVAQVEARAGRPDVRAVLLASDRLSELPGFQSWVAARFRHRRDLGGNRTLYWR